jgi:hypothetical protein
MGPDLSIRVDRDAREVVFFTEQHALISLRNEGAEQPLTAAKWDGCLRSRGDSAI